MNTYKCVCVHINIYIYIISPDEAPTQTDRAKNSQMSFLEEFQASKAFLFLKSFYFWKPNPKSELLFLKFMLRQ